jgi:hypothetical protein
MAHPWIAAAGDRLSLGSLGIALLLLSGCASAPLARDATPSAPLRQAAPEEVLAAWDDYCRGIRTLSASGDLTLRDTRAGKSGRLSVRVVAARGDRLYLKGSVAVVTGVEVSSDGERFWFSVPSKQKVWTGLNGVAPQPEEAADENEPYYALRPVDVSQALLPEPMAPGAGETLVFSGERESFVLTLAESRVGLVRARRRVWLDRETLLPKRAQRFDEDGDLVTDVAWRGWDDGRPHDVTIVRPLDGYLAHFLLTRVRSDVDVPERAFTGRTPDGYEVIEVQD